MAKWTEINQQLQVFLSKEIDLRREILGNMNQQEYVLLIGDIELKDDLYRECSKLAARLKEVIKERGVLTRMLFDLTPLSTIGTTLDEVLDPLVDIESETLHLYQRAKELTDKIHGQHLRNKSLHEMILKEGPLEMNNSAVHAEAVQGKKVTLITKDLFDSLFFITETLHQKCLINVWCPHGNSDKGHSSYFMEGLSKEKRAFVYGQKMMDFLKEKGAFEQLEDLFILGNYRYKYYLQHIEFYQNILEEKLPINRKHRTLLYAPTWKDSERSSSFEIAHSFLINSVPKDWNLIIKPHPHLKCSIKSPKENVIILEDFPPIYPLLQSIDVYLGDMSSIGYDFLTFRRPLFFYNPQNRNPNEDQGLYLTQCGTIIDTNENPFEKIDEIDPVSFLKIQV